MASKEKTLEQTYQRLSPLEHILRRPDTYIGSIELETASLWIKPDNCDSLIEKNIEYVPGLYKIFDEILVNAADNYQRTDCPKRMDEIRVIIDEEQNLISVRNNGKGIPVDIHKEQKMYVPELIFGHLHTGSNYDDDEKKIVGGRNGYGAKLANIFSTSFILECGDGSKSAKSFRMEWQDNMHKKSEAKIEKYKGDDYTCITFKPDLKRFKLNKMTPDIIALLKKRAYDMAGIFNGKVKVYLNNERIKIKNFKEYIELYIPDVADEFKIYDKAMTNERWEVLVSFSDGSAKQVSFVNGICTSRGGTHVQFIMDKIVDEVKKGIQRKNKKIEVKSNMIKQHLWIFVNCLIVNPTFDSQTKETLTLKPSQFGSQCEITEKFIKGITNSGVIDTIINQAKAKENDKLLKTLKGGKKTSRLLGIDKLEDANNAGTKRSENCTIILTEGDSAKALAMAGIEVVGRDNFGVFPLRGKLLNVRGADPKQILKNAEIQNLIKIIGLEAKKEYTDLKSLRYGSVMIMADQDHDGSHIKGLIINLFQTFWPSLFSFNGFLREFVTPIVKCKTKRGDQEIKFFTLTEYKAWLERNNNPNYWKAKYYKGLGTSDNKEAIEYFEDIDQHQLDFQYVDDHDDAAIDMVFSKDKSEQRKRWLADFYDPDICIDHSNKLIRYQDFVNKELIHFSNADNIRSIPQIMDGFKPGQRKILFSCFKRNLKEEIKVAQLSGYVSEKSMYHHGEMSLQTTIIGMAQNFMGSNNINLLLPNGQFGSRNMGGKEHASARYLYTNLNRITRKIFPEHDDHSLKYLEDENVSVEPEFYVPIIPMCLVNGAEGIGTGWSTNIPCYNPKDIVENLKMKLDGQEFYDMTPYYRGFQGEIIEISGRSNSQLESKKYNMKGLMYEKEDEDNIIEITELPVGVWTRNYKTEIEKIMEKDEGIQDLKEYHACDRIHFQLICDLKKLKDVKKKLKIEKSLSTSNMVLFDKNQKLVRYNNTIDILNAYYDVRLDFYQKRKDYLLSKIQRDIEINENKMKYIRLILNDQIRYKNVKRKEIVKQLQDHGLVPMSKITKVLSTKNSIIQKEQKEEANKSDDEEDELEDEELNKQYAGLVNPKEYDYLCTMPMWSLTIEKIKKLGQVIDQKNDEKKQLEQVSIQQLWKNDLEEFLVTYEEILEQDELDRKAQRSGKARNKQGTSKPRKARGPVQRKNKDKTESASDIDDFKKKIKKKQTTPSQREISSDDEKKNNQKTRKKKIDNKDSKIKEENDKNSQSSKQTMNQKPKEEKQKNPLDMTLEERLKLKEKDQSFSYKVQKNQENLQFNEDTIKPKKQIKKMKIDDDDEDNYDEYELIGKTKPTSKYHFNKDSEPDSDQEFKQILNTHTIKEKSSDNEEESKQINSRISGRRVLKVIDSDNEDFFSENGHNKSSSSDDYSADDSDESFY